MQTNYIQHPKTKFKGAVFVEFALIIPIWFAIAYVSFSIYLSYRDSMKTSEIAYNALQIYLDDSTNLYANPTDECVRLRNHLTGLLTSSGYDTDNYSSAITYSCMGDDCCDENSDINCPNTCSDPAKADYRVIASITLTSKSLFNSKVVSKFLGAPINGKAISALPKSVSRSAMSVCSGDFTCPEQ